MKSGKSQWFTEALMKEFSKGYDHGKNICFSPYYVGAIILMWVVGLLFLLP